MKKFALLLSLFLVGVVVAEEKRPDPLVLKAGDQIQVLRSLNTFRRAEIARFQAESELRTAQQSLTALLDQLRVIYGCDGCNLDINTMTFEAQQDSAPKEAGNLERKGTSPKEKSEK